MTKEDHIEQMRAEVREYRGGSQEIRHQMWHSILIDRLAAALAKIDELTAAAHTHRDCAGSPWSGVVLSLKSDPATNEVVNI